VVFALLGENGAGKTTSIRTLLGLETPTAGSATVLGLDSRRKGIEIRRRVGYVPEQPALYEWMTVSEIGWFTAGFYTEDFLPRYYELVKEFELPLKKKIRTLSKGMKAKVSLSLAMAHTPELLILDEPTSGLDTLVRRSFLESMVDVAADNRTVLLSSHQIPEVERVADIVAIMNEGKLLVCEPLEQLKSRLEQWTISLDAGASQLPDNDLTILMQEQTGRQVKITVNQPEDESLWHLRDHPAIAEIDVHVPSLEEIFITYIRRNEQPDTADAPATEQIRQVDP
ncbi:MAG: ABC transporter ATP-binding protein, partial [Pirellulaceae bacterium]